MTKSSEYEKSTDVFSGKIRSKCYFCGGPIEFGPEETSVVCKWCRRTNERPISQESLDVLRKAPEVE